MNDIAAKLIGRPSEFTQEVADGICIRLMDGESLREICRDEAMPSRVTVYAWLNANKAFLNQYQAAREIQADTIADEMKEIADDGRNDWMERHSKDGESLGWQLNGEAVARSRLRIDQRKWHAARLNPRKYGDRVQTDVQALGADGKPTTPVGPILNIVIEGPAAATPQIEDHIGDRRNA